MVDDMLGTARGLLTTPWDERLVMALRRLAQSPHMSRLLCTALPGMLQRAGHDAACAVLCVDIVLQPVCKA